MIRRIEKGETPTLGCEKCGAQYIEIPYSEGPNKEFNDHVCEDCGGYTFECYALKEEK